MSNASVAFPFLLISAAACGGSPRPTPTEALEPVARDSGGVMLLEHATAAFAAVPEIALGDAPIATVSGSADDESSDISTITLSGFLSDGSFFGYDRQRSKVVVFSADGSDRREHGQRGNGPGEFGVIAGLFRLHGDTMVANDPANGLAHLFTAGLAPAGQVSLRAAMGQSGFGVIGSVGSSYLVQGSFPAAESSGVPFGIKGMAVDAAGDSVRTVFRNAEEAADEGPRSISLGGGTVAVAVALPSTSAGRGFGVFPELQQWAGTFMLVDPYVGRVDRWGMDGALKTSLRLPTPGVAVTDRIWAAQVDRMIGQMRGGGTSMAVTASGAVMGGGGGLDTAAIRQQMLAEEHADSLPRFSGAEVTPNGTLWLREYQTPGSGDWSLLAVDQSGKLLGRLAGTDDNPPLLIGNDRVLFRTEDDLGIATFEVRRLIWP